MNFKWPQIAQFSRYPLYIASAHGHNWSLSVCHILHVNVNTMMRSQVSISYFSPYMVNIEEYCNFQTDYFRYAFKKMGLFPFSIFGHTWSLLPYMVMNIGVCIDTNETVWYISLSKTIRFEGSIRIICGNLPTSH